MRWRGHSPGRGRRACAAALSVLFTAVGLACAGDSAGPDADGLTRLQANGFLRAHNAWRGRTGAPALRWADDLAASARARATYLAAHGCALVHHPLPEEIGENLYKAGPWESDGQANTLAAVTASTVVDAWGAECADHGGQTTGASSRECGHYTQMVWATTEEVGCGMAVCPTLGQIWVCHYRPAGNVQTLRRR